MNSFLISVSSWAGFNDIDLERKCIHNEKEDSTAVLWKSLQKQIRAENAWHSYYDSVIKIIWTASRYIKDAWRAGDRGDFSSQHSIRFLQNLGHFYTLGGVMTDAKGSIIVPALLFSLCLNHANSLHVTDLLIVGFIKKKEIDVNI